VGRDPATNRVGWDADGIYTDGMRQTSRGVPTQLVWSLGRYKHRRCGRLPAARIL